MIGLEELCDISPSTHHNLLHAPRVLSHKGTHIIHLAMQQVTFTVTQTPSYLATDSDVGVLWPVQSAELLPSEVAYWLAILLTCHTFLAV